MTTNRFIEDDGLELGRSSPTFDKRLSLLDLPIFATALRLTGAFRIYDLKYNPSYSKKQNLALFVFWEACVVEKWLFSV